MVLFVMWDLFFVVLCDLYVVWLGARVAIFGREMTCDALVEAEGTTPLIGQIPLEGLDLVVDPKTRDVHVNPVSPDVPLMELLRVA